MTKEERNNKLKYLITCMKCEVSGKCCDENCGTQYDAGNMGEIIKNLEEISKILEQEPCEDAVSRQAVCEFLENHAKTYDDVRVRMGLKVGSSLVTNPDNVPSVTPASKKCNNKNNDYDDCDQFVCSRCGIELQDWHAVERDEDGDITYHGYEFKYCPNCGARIRSEE